jgi:hypothetical protein
LTSWLGVKGHIGGLKRNIWNTEKKNFCDKN